MPVLKLPPQIPPDLELIETLGWNGATFVRLERHLSRLARGAEALGWGCDLAALRAALSGAVAGAPARLRLTLASSGAISVQTVPMPAAATRWRVGLSEVRLQSSDPWLRLKSTHRRGYDLARSRMPPGLDEVILLNERGEVCDGSITTVFYDAGAGLCTPPVSCGLLPGVLRAEMLETRRCREAALPGGDLGKVRLWVGNSLRGLIAVDWCPPMI